MRFCSTKGVVSPDMRVRLVSPIIAFMGVLISWLMRDRKSDLAWLVSSAFFSFNWIILVRIR